MEDKTFSKLFSLIFMATGANWVQNVERKRKEISSLSNIIEAKT